MDGFHCGKQCCCVDGWAKYAHGRFGSNLASHWASNMLAQPFHLNPQVLLKPDRRELLDFHHHEGTFTAWLQTIRCQGSKNQGLWCFLTMCLVGSTHRGSCHGWERWSGRHRACMSRWYQADFSFSISGDVPETGFCGFAGGRDGEAAVIFITESLLRELVPPSFLFEVEEGCFHAVCYVPKGHSLHIWKLGLPPPSQVPGLLAYPSIPPMVHPSIPQHRYGTGPAPRGF